MQAFRLQATNIHLLLGPNGPILLQDHYLIQEDGSVQPRTGFPNVWFTPKAEALTGFFEVTEDVTLWCKAKFSEQERAYALPCWRGFHGRPGSGIRRYRPDPRGFALKFYTQEGTTDLVGNNTPIFFIRDPQKFQDSSFAKAPRR